MLARFPLEIHVWTVPLLLATGIVIGYSMFRDRLRRRHPDLFEEWRRRTQPPPEGRP
ncbi:MAG: hypothetical protein ACREID_09380 [Planctomycetota bacterium]